MESSVRKLFERYESVFNRALGGDIDMDEAAALYASQFIAASPAGVTAGKNDDRLGQVMAQGYARYRAMGTREMRLRDVRLSPIDDRHCVAHVAWTAIYARKDRPDAAIDFDVHYFVQMLDGEGFRLGVGRRTGASQAARHPLKLVFRAPRKSGTGRDRAKNVR